MVVYYPEVPRRALAADGGCAGARAGSLQCGARCRADFALWAHVWMVGMVECGFLEGLEQGHDAGWVGGKGRAKENHSPLLWCTW